MAWAIKFDGVNDYMSLASPKSFSNTGEYVIELSFKIDALTANDIHSLLYLDTSNHFYYRISTEVLFWRFAGSTRTLSAASGSVLGNDIVVDLVQDAAGTKTIESDVFGISAPFVTLRTFDFDEIVRPDNWRFEGLLNYIKVYSDVAKTTLVNYWSPDDSSHAAGTPILIDTIGGNNATGVNMPTDGSAWVDLGGGGFQAAWAMNANKLLNWYN